MRIKSLDLFNFRGFDELQLNFHPELNVIVGTNGCGKSSIIDAAAILLSRFFLRIAPARPGVVRVFSPLDIRNDCDYVHSVVSVEYENREFGWNFSKVRDISKKRNVSQPLISVLDIKKIAERIHDSLDENNKFNVPIAVLYGTNRLVQDIPLRIRTHHEFSQLDALDQALSGVKIEFRSFFEWFRNQEDIENQEIRKKGAAYRDRNLTAVKTAIGKLTGFTGITVNRNPLRMDVKKGKSMLDIRQMSDGEKCLIAMVGDLARRLAMANPGLKNPLDGHAVVLIDEIELHLHPAWQRSVISGLRRTFPNCQFIVSTHSPQVIGECPRECIILLKGDGNRNVVVGNPPQSLGMGSNLILETLMDVPSRNSKIAKEINEIYRLIDKEDVAGAKRKIQALRKKIDGDLPDLVGAETAMTWLED